MKVPEIEGFEVLEHIGAGGMASVWKARQLSLDRIVAVKILYSDFTSDPDDVERFKTEAQTAARLKHTGIVQVYDAHVADDICYFVMEYISGYTVGEWLLRKGVLPVKEALLVTQCIAEALNYAWDAAQLIHCDIKPDNILVDADGTVKVSDLGLARTLSVFSTEKENDVVMGTPQFVAPEQAMGEADLDCRTDIYSLGAMLYHMTTGRMPFEGHAAETIMDMQVTHTIPDPLELNPTLPRPVAWLIEKMMCKSREGRQQSWEEVLQDIERVRKGQRPTDVPPDGASTVTRSAKRAKKRVLPKGKTPVEKKRSTALVRSVLLVLLVLAIFVAYRHLRYMQRVEEAREARVRAENERVTEPVELDPSDPTLQAVPNSRLAQVDDWVSENPDDLQGAIARYEELAGDHPGTTAGETAKLRIEELLEQKEQAVVDTLDSLASLAAPLIELGSFEEAAKLYESYVGTHAAETAEERRRRAQEIRNSVFEAPEPAPAEPVKSFARLLDETVGLMVSHKMSDASEMLVDALDNRAYEAEYGRLEQYLEILRTASGSDENVKNSFRRDRGRQIAVQFRSGKKQLEIVDVRGDKIVAKMVRNGAVIGGSFDFSVKQLGYLEILRRLGDDSDPGIALAKGLLALRAGSNAYARRYFAKLDPMLAERLIASVP